MSFFVGIDIGHQSIKVVLLDGSRVLGSSCTVTGEDAAAGSRRAVEALFADLGLKPDLAVMHLAATGVGRDGVRAAVKKYSDILSHSAGARVLHPSARTVVNIGAETYRAMSLDETGMVLEFAENDKCAAGSGIFLDEMSSALEVTVREAGTIALKARRREKISSLCVVFAESEVVSAVHRRVPREEILAGMHESIVERIAAIVGRVRAGPDLVLTGGPANNPCIVQMLKEKIALPPLVPESPELTGALGAAVLVRKSFLSASERNR